MTNAKDKVRMVAIEMDRRYAKALTGAHGLQEEEKLDRYKTATYHWMTWIRREEL